MSENADRRHSTVRWRTEEGAVRLNAGTLESASAFENSSTRGKARLPDTSDKPCRPGALNEELAKTRGDRDAVQNSSPADNAHRGRRLARRGQVVGRPCRSYI